MSELDKLFRVLRILIYGVLIYLGTLFVGPFLLALFR
jgi:hypothetical protein